MRENYFVFILVVQVNDMDMLGTFFVHLILCLSLQDIRC